LFPVEKILAGTSFFFAHEYYEKKDLSDIIQAIRPTALIGISGQANAFSKNVLELMKGINDYPLVFALSNPTSSSECTAENAYKWTRGKCLFASGSPFDSVEIEGKTFIPGQGNNAYIFPGVGLGIILSKAEVISDDLFLAAAETLSILVSDKELSSGQLYPSIKDIKKVSKEIAITVAKKAFSEGLTNMAIPQNIESSLDRIIYNPVYPDYI
jgi:Malic enzyme